MAGERLSLQDVMRRRRGGGAFVGRRDEMAVFLGNLDTEPGDEARHVLFHVHGPAGVGKSTLLARLAQEARARGALTATADHDAMTVPAAMAAVAADLAGQDRPLKAFDRLYAAYRQRRYEAEALGAAGSPSAGSAVVAQAGLAGLGLVPGLSLVAGAVDPGRVAEGVDRLRAAGSSRFRNEQDLQLLLDPVAVLSPVFTADLASAAAGARWLTLFFDTYERTGPVLDGWLRDLLLDGRYGALPANVVVTLAGQGALDRAGWAGSLDIVTPLPLGPFSEAEARELLAAKGVTDEAVVAAVLRLTDRLPLLVSTLAATRPSGAEAVGDPADTAVERFLAWERDPAARAAALAAALPPHLDEDVYRVAVGDDVPAAADRYDWLLGLPFVDSAGGHARYHDLVRSQMLRLTRTRSPQRWRDRHERLAAAHAAWRERAARGRSGGDLWADATWRDHRRHESYHLLCADPGAALADTLLHLCRAATAGADTARRWTSMLAAAATDADAPDLAHWSRSLAALYRTHTPGATVPAARRGEPHPPPGGALGGERAVAVVSLVLDGDALDREQRAVAYAVRAWAQRQAGRPEAGLADYDRAARLGLGTFRLYAERGATHWTLGRPEQAAADYARALTADPADPQAQTVRAQRGGALLQAGRTAEAIAELDAAVAADPGGAGPARVFRAMALLQLDRPADALADVEECIAAAAPDPDTLALRGLVRQRLGSNEQALADFDTALVGRPDPAAWVLTGRGLALEALGRYADAAESFARAVDQGGATDADTLTHRARLLRLAGRTGQAVAAAERACVQHPDSAAAARELAYALSGAGRLQDAADAFGRVLTLEGGADDALTALARIHVLLGRPAAALADLDRLTGPAPAWLPGRRAQLLVLAGDIAGATAVLDADGAHTLDDLLTLAVCHREQRRYAEAAATLDRAGALAPGHGAVALERALLTALTDGPDAARPLWLALRAAGEPEGVLPEVFRAVLAAGLGRWDDAGVHIAAVLAGDAPWPARAALARTLTALTPPTPLPPPLTAPP
ncbi:ATP-binding protein [Actinacidiphila bryophytorum]|uniref:Tetratricopeptide repeat protein n=2 Tax=Actinacidiphila bryophytorum TaxID=1436133 RepID=A0A9W4H0Q2_9ACTN|nr:ATP-binding protein [Actinacidiphila bryophytorum]MBM9439383.1 tetratricopeptide repeat protein [Actinacidiphila bryophytorum]CAG7638706.1 Tetratricopeptide repeat protein [Actinacidiphila bryophytorum]